MTAEPGAAGWSRAAVSVRWRLVSEEHASRPTRRILVEQGRLWSIVRHPRPTYMLGIAE